MLMTESSSSESTFGLNANALTPNDDSQFIASDKKPFELRLIGRVAGKNRF